MNYEQALEYIHSITWRGSRPGLSRTQELLEKIGNPEKSFKAVHIVGTNGKGSTSAFIESVLRKAGYKTGLYTSPYIWRFNERIRFCGDEISDSDLAEVTEFVKPFAEEMIDPPTEFELITAIGFEYFTIIQSIFHLGLFFVIFISDDYSKSITIILLPLRYC